MKEKKEGRVKVKILYLIFKKGECRDVDNCSIFCCPPISGLQERKHDLSQVAGETEHYIPTHAWSAYVREGHSLSLSIY